MKPWQIVNISSPSKVPTMLSYEERQYLYWLGSSVWKGTSAVVEIGPWLGGSTICLAAGMRKNPNMSAGKWFHAYDNFVWVDYMGRRFPLPLRTGESFESYFLQNVAEYRDFIVSNRVELPDEILASDPETSDPIFLSRALPVLEWPKETGVEILFVDAAKSWSAFRHVLMTFSPALGPGSLLVCQDYKCWGTYWITALTEALSQYMEWIHILGMNTVTFRVTKSIPQQELKPLQNITLEEGISLIQASAKRLADQGDLLGSAIVKTGLVNFVVHKSSDFARAVAFYRVAADSWPIGQNIMHLTRCRSWLEARLGKQVPRSNHEKLLMLYERGKHIGGKLLSLARRNPGLH